MKTRRALLASLAVVLLAPAAAPADDAASLKGAWKITSLSFNGGQVPDGVLKDLAVTFDGKTYSNSNAKGVVEEGEYTIDPSKTPKTIEFSIKKGDDAGKKQLGIYKLEGDVLTIAVTQPGTAAVPKGFESTKDVPLLVTVLKPSKK